MYIYIYIHVIGGGEECELAVRRRRSVRTVEPDDEMRRNLTDVQPAHVSETDSTLPHSSPGSGMMNSVLRQLSLRRVENGDH
uniref:Uncharacterized protein n=1 Tax=Physcomitrium patens TaxID=3218 RepID=A0A2K1LAE3_PHYPA|nr:hypothetical protein PHYPA_001422 [Physcomitrium patens]